MTDDNVKSDLNIRLTYPKNTGNAEKLFNVRQKFIKAEKLLLRVTWGTVLTYVIMIVLAILTDGLGTVILVSMAVFAVFVVLLIVTMKKYDRAMERYREASYDFYWQAPEVGVIDKEEGRS